MVLDRTVYKKVDIITITSLYFIHWNVIVLCKVFKHRGEKCL